MAEQRDGHGVEVDDAAAASSRLGRVDVFVAYDHGDRLVDREVVSIEADVLPAQTTQLTGPHTREREHTAHHLVAVAGDEDEELREFGRRPDAHLRTAVSCGRERPCVGEAGDIA